MWSSFEMGTAWATKFRKVIAKVSWLIINLLWVPEETPSQAGARRDAERSCISWLQREYWKHCKLMPILRWLQEKRLHFRCPNSPCYNTLFYISSSGPPTSVCIRITWGGLLKHRLLPPPNSFWISRWQTGPAHVHFSHTSRWCWRWGCQDCTERTPVLTQPPLDWTLTSSMETDTSWSPFLGTETYTYLNNNSRVPQPFFPLQAK